MKPRIQISLREILLISTAAALALALYRSYFIEAEPMYLHVYGSMVDSNHDDQRPANSPKSPHWDVPWTRIASVQIFDGRPFGFFTPNERSPAVGIDGRLSRGFDTKYRGSLHFLLDDSNLTFDFTEQVELIPEQIVTIDAHFDIYLLSAEEDPYWALSEAFASDGGEPSDATESR